MLPRHSGGPLGVWSCIVCSHKISSPVIELNFISIKVNTLKKNPQQTHTLKISGVVADERSNYKINFVLIEKRMVFPPPAPKITTVSSILKLKYQRQKKIT